MDDFNYDAIAWTLTAHEARPGHELQFASMLERGVSTARVVFAFNSANVEGWALYAEAVMKQYLPLDGQIGALQMRMMRAARAFLDPMLNLGHHRAGRRQALPDGRSDAVRADGETGSRSLHVPRRRARRPRTSTATARLEAMRTRLEMALGAKFDEQPLSRFHRDAGPAAARPAGAGRERGIPGQVAAGTSAGVGRCGCMRNRNLLVACAALAWSGFAAGQTMTAGQANPRPATSTATNPANNPAIPAARNRGRIATAGVVDNRRDCSQLRGIDKSECERRDTVRDDLPAGVTSGAAKRRR